VLADTRCRRHCGVYRERDAERARRLELPHLWLADANRATGRDDMRIGEPVVKAIDAVCQNVAFAKPLEPTLGRVASSIAQYGAATL